MSVLAVLSPVSVALTPVVAGGEVEKVGASSENGDRRGSSLDASQLTLVLDVPLWKKLGRRDCDDEGRFLCSFDSRTSSENFRCAQSLSFLEEIDLNSEPESPSAQLEMIGIYIGK